ncbi:helix-turn-helix domain-containing protein [Bifidobacterium avesanii]|uniref:Helix-turn-helix domain-containing protein n=1 Tax=Bifidobacterium avesanii TaxID=1798157 RepID=A0A7K3TJ43_9BIFI|nr:AraC family transcriptional regulator [Bifidobacterium avesanii]KAB8289570.1 AraC family transcriptional regulator [Bifidobacterium avesanii]NEG79125.1 helix-turn-helix domain-containing protein [Bifidobacterium avesanii]
MLGYSIDVTAPVRYDYTGKFEAPSPLWRHEDMGLGDWELIVMTEGTLYLSYLGEDHTVGEGEYLLLPPSADGRRVGFRESRCSFYWMHFQSSDREVREMDLAGPLPAAPTPPISPERPVGRLPDENPAVLYLPQAGAMPDAERLLVMLRQLQDAVRSGYERFALGYLATGVLCELYHQVFQEKTSADIADHARRQLYYDIVDYVNLNLARNLKVQDVARHFGYNPKYLSQLFRALAGESLRAFIVGKRMERANWLLTDTNDTVGQVAAALGFRDAHHFMRAYKDATGMTPTQYRNAYAKRMLFHR